MLAHSARENDRILVRFCIRARPSVTPPLYKTCANGGSSTVCNAGETAPLTGDAMENGEASSSLSRRQLLRMIGATAGSAAMYQAMSSLGFAAVSTYEGPIDLQGAPRGASVLILGAGMAGPTAAYELRHAGYKGPMLEYNSPPGGRNCAPRRGDARTDMGAHTPQCQLEKSLSI